MTVSCSIPDTTATCLPLLVTAAVRRSGVAGEEDLSLRLPGNLEPVPRALDDLDAGAREAGVRGEETVAERHAEALDLGAGVLPGGGVDEAFQRFAREEAGQSPVDEGLGEIPLETAGDGQIAGIMAIAAPHDPQHAQVGLAVAAGTNTEHGRTIAHGGTSDAAASRIMSD